MKARLFACFALLLGLFAARAAAADERVQNYEVDVWPDPHANAATYRLRLEYVAPAGAPKQNGFKYFGKSSVSDWKVTDKAGNALAFTSKRESGSDEVKLDFTVPRPAQPGGSQVVLIELRQSLSVACGFTRCAADVPWAHQFKIPVSRMLVRVHGERATSEEYFQCEGAGADAVCTRDTAFVAELAVPLRLRFGTNDALGLLLWLATLGLLGYFVPLTLRRRKEAILRIRGVIMPAAEPAYPEPAGYRAPPVFAPAVAVEPELAVVDATSQRNRTTVIWVMSTLTLVIVAAGVRTSLPMTLTMAIATGLVVTFSSIYGARETGGLWLLLVPLLAAIGFAAAGLIPALACVAISLVAHLISLAPPGTFQSSGGSSWSSSSSSSCGGGGGGGGCGGGGGGGGCGG